MRPGPAERIPARAGGQGRSTQRHAANGNVTNKDLGSARSDNRVDAAKGCLDLVAREDDLDDMRVGDRQAIGVDDGRPWDELDAVGHAAILSRLIRLIKDIIIHRSGAERWLFDGHRLPDGFSDKAASETPPASRRVPLSGKKGRFMNTHKNGPA